MKNKKLGQLGGSLIVAGTSIGAGMLALPVITGPSGFIPSMAVLFVSWAFATSTGILFAELSIWLKKEVNFLTMAETTLGKYGKLATWIVYLFFFYCLLVAYLVGGANLLCDLTSISDTSTRILLFAVVFVSLITIGKNVIDPINRVLMIGLFAAYFGFVVISYDSVDVENLAYMDWGQARWAMPIALASFGFQGTVPTLCSWMNYDKKCIHKAIVSGTLITLCVYIVWQALFLGIVPLKGPNGLLESLQAGHDAIHPLQFFTQSAWILAFGKVFAFCALATSFLGVGIGVMDFLRDGLHMQKKGFVRYSVLIVLSFGIPLLFALSYPHVFIKALGMAGGFGSTLLLGVLPIAMVWRAKYDLKKNLVNGTFLSNRFILSLMILVLIFEIWTQIEAT